jgi:hypothetical protein
MEFTLKRSSNTTHSSMRHIQLLSLLLSCGSNLFKWSLHQSQTNKTSDPKKRWCCCVQSRDIFDALLIHASYRRLVWGLAALYPPNIKQKCHRRRKNAPGHIVWSDCAPLWNPQGVKQVSTCVSLRLQLICASLRKNLSRYLPQRFW